MRSGKNLELGQFPVFGKGDREKTTKSTLVLSKVHPRYSCAARTTKDLS